MTNSIEAITTWGIAVSLVSIRLNFAFFSTPIISSFKVPAISRITLLLGLSLLFSEQIINSGIKLPTEPSELLVATFYEAAIGLTLGFGIKATFSALEFSGRLVEAQSGLSLASFYNPALEQQDSITGAALSMAGLIMFMAIDGHHSLLRIFSETLLIAPIGSSWSANLGTIIGFLGKTYFFGFAIGASAALALWLIDVAMAITVRSMPQFQILFLSFPIKLLLLLIVLALLIPHLAPAIISLFELQEDYWQNVLVPNGR